MSVSKVSITKEEYDELKMTEKLLAGYVELSDESAYPIYRNKCQYKGCSAIWLTDNRDRDYFIDCDDMHCDDDDKEYCDKHQHRYLLRTR